MKSLFLFCLIIISCLGVKSQEAIPCSYKDDKKLEKLLKEATEEGRKKNYSQFFKLINKLISEREDHAEAYLIKAFVEQSQGLYAKAAQTYQTLIEFCPDYSPEPYYFLASEAFAQHEYDKSISLLEKYMTFQDPDPMRRKNAERLLNTGRFRENSIQHPVPFDPQPLEEICTDEDEYLPIISPDQEVAFFTRRYLSKGKDKLTDQLVEEFTFSKKMEHGFYKGEKMPFPFNTNSNEGGATITIDNKDLYFTICRPELKNINCDIYHSHFEKNKWSPIENLGNRINDKEYWDSQPSVSPDGNTLYFASNREGGMGGIDIYRCEKDSDGQWGKPINLGPPVNTAGNEKSPFFHTDNHTLYFSSDSLPGMGSYDIFFTRESSPGVWSEPKNLGYPINSESDDLGFFVSTDGQTGYFASNKLQGKGGWDIYSFPLYPEARPEKVLFMKGRLLDEKTGKALQGEVQFEDLKTKKLMKFKVDSASGEYVSALNFSRDYMMKVKGKDMLPLGKLITRRDSQYNRTFVHEDLYTQKVEIGNKISIKDIHFATNSYELNDTSKVILMELLQFLEENPGVKIRINGHTDNLNDAVSNQILSEKRAEAVYNFLIASHIDSARLSFKGFGESIPVADNNSETGRSSNRRTEIEIMDK